MTGLLRDAGPVVADVLDGKHDDLLPQLLAAVQHRQQQTLAKGGIRKGARVRIANDPRAREYAGREGVVDRVSQKTVSISLVCPACGSASEDTSASSEDACKTCYGMPDGVRISPGLVEVIR